MSERHPHLKSFHFEYFFLHNPKKSPDFDNIHQEFAESMTLAVYALENDGCAGNGPSVLIGLLDHCQIGRYTGKVRRGCYCIAIEFRVFFFLSLFYF